MIWLAWLLGLTLTALVFWFGRKALLLDVPYVLDSITRHADYLLNRLHPPRLDGDRPVIRSAFKRPPFWLFVVVLFFTAYGPTYNSLCGLGFPTTVITASRGIGVVLMILAVVLWVWSFWKAASLFKRRVARLTPEPSLVRRRFVQLIILALAIPLTAPMIYLGWTMFSKDMPGGCLARAADWPAFVQLGMLVLAVALAVPVFDRKAKDPEPEGPASSGKDRDRSIQNRILFEMLAILALVVMTFYAQDGAQSQARQVPYPHVFGVVALGLAVIAYVSTYLIGFPFESVSDDESGAAKDALRDTELFAPSRRDPELSLRRVLGGLVTNLMDKPLHFLVLPAFAVLLAPAEHIKPWCVLATCASGLLLIAGSLTTRWDRMLQYLKRYFLLGTPLVVSVAVMVVAALRLGGVQYATTLLNVAPFGVLFLWMVMAYALCWWFEYEANSILAARMLAIFGARDGRDDALVDYRFARQAIPGKTFIEPDSCYLTGHGMGELIVIGRGKRPLPQGHAYIPAFEAYSFIELVQKLLGRSHPDQAHELVRRAQLYFSLVNVLIVVGFGGLAWHWGHGDRANTIAAVVTTHQPPVLEDTPANLAKLLGQDAAHPMPSAIVVSASGGGTRAALYTAMTLQGLHDAHADDRVVLLSGVSGGAVAAAYFYGHRDALVHDQPTTCLDEGEVVKGAWNCYAHRMTMPFIDDVLRGASEWRIQSDEPLGVLLAESFERRLFEGHSMTLGSRSDLGLVLNTTVPGHPLEDASALDGTMAWPDHKTAENCEWPVSAMGGGRLAFSNLLHVKAFTMWDADAPSITMPFVVLEDRNIALARAAALSANFPPVFPNARVNVAGWKKVNAACDERSYFVTDGGATENLSLVSALLAIDSALQEMGPDDKVRDIDIVLAEASALTFDYTQDRGIGAATDQSKERLTGRLTLELLQRIKDELRPRGAKITVHDVSLPRVFRSRGGFGTHWEFPDSIHIEDPLDPPQTSDWHRLAAFFGDGSQDISLDRDQVIEVWRALYAPDAAFCGPHTWQHNDGDKLDLTKDWICGVEPGQGAGKGPVAHEDPQIRRWNKLKEALAASGPTP